MIDINLIDLLDYIDPSILSYNDWLFVGMALKDEGYDCSVWDNWSSRDNGRYKSGECERKWNTFGGAMNPVTIGTIVQMAKDNGWSCRRNDSRELDWDDVIDEDVIIKKDWIENKEIHIPEHWNPAKQIITYLDTLFESTENVGYVTECWEQDDGVFKPKRGNYDRTAGQLVNELSQCDGDIGAVFGDYKEEVGAWIRFNPLDGNGVKNENVTDYRYALVESDDMEIEKQNAIIRELELPVACLVHSGGKSIHAIVKINAPNFPEYQKRVDYLYNICRKNGLTIDTQNRNPSRLSRMPGVMRAGKKQFLLDTNIGKPSWDEWKEWIESINDDLPDPESLDTVWNNLPELSPPLIDGVLRQGHKMLIAGPSKAGKSFALIELCVAVAEGKQWLGFNCTQGKILYVNLELDRASCLHRFKDVYQSLGAVPDNLNNIVIWNLRGNSIPMDKLAPKLIRRASKENFIAIVIDPIYKIITGDENSADQMAHFCNQFDKVCTTLNCAVIYCHHHSKGSQGSKRSMDRASGSGVFARDPDALLDLIELETNDSIIEQEKNNAVIAVCEKWLKRFHINYKEDLSQDDLCNSNDVFKYSVNRLNSASSEFLRNEVKQVEHSTEKRTAWRIEGTLREYPKFSPINLWFDYPIHIIDEIGSLKSVQTDDFNSKNSPWKQNFKGKKSDKERKEERKNSIENAFNYCAENGKASIKELAEHMGVTDKTVYTHLKEHGDFWVDDGKTGLK